MVRPFSQLRLRTCLICVPHLGLMLPRQLLAVSLQRITITHRLAGAVLGGQSLAALMLLLDLGLRGRLVGIRGDLRRRYCHHEGSEDEESQDDALSLAIHVLHLPSVSQGMERSETRFGSSM
jgi:hypothetical protein